MALAGIITGVAANDADASDLRCPGERRSMTWRTVAYGFLLSRRRAARRTDDPASIYSDWHHPWLFFLAVGIMLMSAADAFLTLKLLALGAVEANPVMRGLIHTDTTLFVSLKLLMTAGGLFVLIYASHYRLFGRLRVGLLVTAFFCGYLTLISSELMGLMLLADTGFRI